MKDRKELLSKIGIYNTKAKIPIIVSTLKRLTKKIENKIWQRNYYEHIIRNERKKYSN